jgi:hypothetical protein
MYRDGRIHRRYFPVGESAYIEVYAAEQPDGMLFEQGVSAPEINELSSAGALEYAGALMQAAGFMQLHGIGAPQG